MDRSLGVASVHMVCWTPWNVVRVNVGLANTCLHLEITPANCLEVETEGGPTFTFAGLMQKDSKTLFRPTPLQQPTVTLQPCLRALHVSASPLLVSAPWMPDVPHFLSLSAPCFCARERDCRAIGFIWITGASGWTGVWRWTRCTRLSLIHI